ncbi:META domain-containing protein [Microbacterium sp. G2-8]|uniref:META domain-containing protein n=1 Tax=Microbacterium sp. G2-8 TaxID=2842454 RepID=UPI001C8AE5B6|nr:META domain-containing protein [Microbacterium sp. G2-8]
MDPQTFVGATFLSSENGRPRLTFSSDGTYSGSDGCNGLQGGYTLDGDTITLAPGLSTLRACRGVDSWLHAAKTLELDGDTLRVCDATGAEIGALTRD